MLDFGHTLSIEIDLYAFNYDKNTYHCSDYVSGVLISNNIMINMNISEATLKIMCRWSRFMIFRFFISIISGCSLLAEPLCFSMLGQHEYLADQVI